MYRDDYAKAPYPKAEWRNVLDFKGCSNIKVYGLTLAESGGDGILLIVPQRGCVPKPRVGRCAGLPWVIKAANPVGVEGHYHVCDPG